MSTGGAVKFRLIGDATSLQKAIADGSKGLAGFAKSAAGSANAGKGAFGALGGALGATGMAGQLGTLQTLLGNLGTGFDALGGKAKGLTAGKILGGAGIATAGVGAALLGASRPLEDANATLKTVVENAGGSMADIKGQVASLDTKMAHLGGHTIADTNTALSKLVAASNDPARAIKDMGVVSEIAAFKHESLADAAAMVAKTYGGSTRPLKEYGINVAALASSGKAATKAHTDEAKAAAELAAKQKALADVKARLGASGGTTGVRDAAALVTAQREQTVAAEGVSKAQARLGTAGQHLQAVQAQITAGTLKGAGAAAALQRAQAEVAAAGQGAADAQTRAAAAGEKVAAAQGKAGAAAALSVPQQQELARAQAAVEAAQAKANTTAAAATATQAALGKGNLDSAQVLDLIHSKIKGVDVAQSETFGGRMRAARAVVENFAATMGDKYGKTLLAAGPLMAGFGGILESGVVGKVGKAGASFVKFGLSAMSGGISAAQAAIPVMLAWAPVVLPILAVAAAAFLIYKNWDTVKGALIGAWNSISSAATTAFGAVEGAVTGAIGWVEGLPARLATLEVDALKWLAGLGANLVQGLWDGISSMGGFLEKKIEGFVKGVPLLGSFFKHTKSSSPSRVMHDLGIGMGQGLANGIDASGQTVQAASIAMAQRAIPKLNVAGLIGPTAPYPAGGAGGAMGAGPAMPGLGTAHFHEHTTFSLPGATIVASDPGALARSLQHEAQLSAMRGEEPVGL